MGVETKQLFLEDLGKGQSFPGPSRNISKADILSFAALTGDRHPIHYDDEYAKATRFGRPIVHGLHLMALTALGASELSRQLTDSMIALLEQQAAFQKPVFEDDTVHSEFEIEGIDHRPDLPQVHRPALPSPHWPDRLPYRPGARAGTHFRLTRASTAPVGQGAIGLAPGSRKARTAGSPPGGAAWAIKSAAQPALSGTPPACS